MNELEKLLGDELAVVDRGVVAPTVDVAGLVAAGRRERRRRTGLAAAAGAAAAVVATVGALAVIPTVVGDSAGPPPAAPAVAVPTSIDDLPVGSASTAPSTGYAVLHAAGASYRFDGEDGLQTSYAAGTTVASLQDGGRWRALVFRDGGVAELASSASADPPYRLVPSADGRLVALSDRVDATRVVLTLYDATTGRVLGSHDYEGENVRDAFSILNVTTDGRVVISAGGYSVWRPGSEPVEVTGLRNTGDPMSYPGGIAQFDSRVWEAGAYGTISDDGRFELVGETGQDDVSWAPGGEVWVYVAENAPGEVVVEGEGRGRETLDLPTDEGWQVVGWESDTDVVLESPVDAGRRPQARCDVDTLTCERIPLAT